MHRRAFCTDGDGAYTQRDRLFVGYPPCHENDYGETVGDIAAVGAGDDYAGGVIYVTQVIMLESN